MASSGGLPQSWGLLTVAELRRVLVENDIPTPGGVVRKSVLVELCEEYLDQSVLDGALSVLAKSPGRRSRPSSAATAGSNFAGGKTASGRATVGGGSSALADDDELKALDEVERQLPTPAAVGGSTAAASRRGRAASRDPASARLKASTPSAVTTSGISSRDATDQPNSSRGDGVVPRKGGGAVAKRRTARKTVGGPLSGEKYLGGVDSSSDREDDGAVSSPLGRRGSSSRYDIGSISPVQRQNVDSLAASMAARRAFLEKRKERLSMSPKEGRVSIAAVDDDDDEIVDDDPHRGRHFQDDRAAGRRAQAVPSADMLLATADHHFNDSDDEEQLRKQNAAMHKKKVTARHTVGGGGMFGDGGMDKVSDNAPPVRGVEEPSKTLPKPPSVLVGPEPFSTLGAGSVPFDPQGRPIVWRISAEKGEMSPTEAARVKAAAKRKAAAGRSTISGGRERNENDSRNNRSRVEITHLGGTGTAVAAAGMPEKRKSVGTSGGAAGRSKHDGRGGDSNYPSAGGAEVVSKGPKTKIPAKRSSGPGFLASAGNRISGKWKEMQDGISSMANSETVQEWTGKGARIVGIGMAVVMAVVALQKTGMFDKIVYCDSGVSPRKVEGCVPCPNHGICTNGSMECSQKYRKEWYNGLWTCVRDTRSYEAAQKYLYALNEHLGKLEGERQCGMRLGSAVGKDELLLYLRNIVDKTSDSEKFETRVSILFDELLPASLAESDDSVVGYRHRAAGVRSIQLVSGFHGEDFYRSAVPMKPWSCRASEAFWGYFLYFVAAAVAAGGCFIWWARRMRRNREVQAVLSIVCDYTSVADGGYAKGVTADEIRSILKSDTRYSDVGINVSVSKIREICRDLGRSRKINSTCLANDPVPHFFSEKAFRMGQLRPYNPERNLEGSRRTDGRDASNSRDAGFSTEEKASVEFSGGRMPFSFPKLL